MPGPPKTPTKILEQRGSWRAKKRGKEPEGTPGVPICPAALTKTELAWWDHLVKLLMPLGILTQQDELPLALLAIQAALLDGVLAAIREAEIGSPAWKRLHSALSDATTQIMRLSARFGMTPSDRAALGTPAPSEPGKDRFFKIAE